MKLKNLALVSTAVAMSMLSGCICVRDRYSATSSVKDIGDRIATRNRYRLVAVYGAEKLGVTGDWTELIMREQPGVFSRNGIPIVVRSAGDSGWLSIHGWTGILAFLTLNLVPDCMGSYADKLSFKLEAKEDRTVAAFFDVERAYENSRGCITALIPFGGPPDVDGRKTFWISDSDVDPHPKTKVTDYEWSIMGGARTLNNEYCRKAFAYAAASMLKELEDTGKIDAMLRKRKPASKAPPHRIAKLSKVTDCDFAYDFAIEVDVRHDKLTSNEMGAVVQEFAGGLVAEYAETYPGVSQSSLRAALSNFKNVGRRIEGRMSVLSITPVALSYDANTRRGKMSVRFITDQEADARLWARKHIGTLARDKNIMLRTGQPPPSGKFAIVGEKVKDNVLDIEFTTE